MEGPPAGVSTIFMRHLGRDCTAQEREIRAVAAGDILSALKDGKGLDLVGVVITGDLMLDQLPLVETSGLPPLSLRVQQRLAGEGFKQIRAITGPISIQDSIVKGVLGTNLKEGLLVVAAPVTMTGTTFEQTFDLSHTAFLGPVDFSQAVFLRQGFFIKALFAQAVRFEKTAFGVHSRFHRAVFEGPVTFHRAGFNGFGEFLEVTFEKEARFSQTYFKMGTGFSGSRFKGTLNFSEALFEREAFFTFTVFEQDAYFRRTAFRGPADFSDAEFRGVDDFSKVLFGTEPRFTRTKVKAEPPSLKGLQDLRIQYGIAAALVVFALVYILILRKI
jgi:uncharacterized protein YjbI with pentapeptide repeats